MRFLTMKDVCELTTLSAAEIARRIERREFPDPIRISKHPRGRKVWTDEALERWMRSWLPSE